MGDLKMRNGILAIMVAFTLGGAGLMACGDDSTPNTTPVGGTGGGAAGGTGGSIGAGGTGGAATDAAPVDGPVTPDGGNTTVDGGAGGCFMGTPTTNEQFLNACPDPAVFKVVKTVTLPGGVKVGDTLPALQ
jgi:hypothetical protein